MVNAFSVAVEKAVRLPVKEQEALAAILMEEITSEQRWSESFTGSQTHLESLALEALAEFKAGKTEPFDEL